MKKSTENTPTQVVLFELENVAANGHAVLYGVLKEALGKKNVELSPATFARFCLNSTVDKFMGRMLSELGRKQISAETLGADVKKNYVKALSAASNKMPTGLHSMIEKAAKKGIAAGALSCLGGETADALAKHLGLDSLGVTIRSREAEGGSCTTKEQWLRLAGSMSALPLLASVAITSTAQACRSALSAGLKVVACPGRYADFGDLSGADAVIDSMDKKSVDLVLSLLEPRQWS